MTEGLLFLFKYFWLFISIAIISVGDTLFIINAIQDFNNTFSIYKKENKDKSFLKGKFKAQIICVIINILIVLVAISLLYYTNEIVAMRKIIANM